MSASEAENLEAWASDEEPAHPAKVVSARAPLTTKPPLFASSAPKSSLPAYQQQEVPQLPQEIYAEILKWDPFLQSSKFSRVEQELVAAIQQGLRLRDEPGPSACNSQHGMAPRDSKAKCPNQAKAEEPSCRRATQQGRPGAHCQQHRGSWVLNEGSSSSVHDRKQHAKEQIAPTENLPQSSTQDVAFRAGKQQIQAWALKAMQEAESRLNSELQHRVFELLDAKEQALQRADQFKQKVVEAIVQLQLVLASCEEEKEKVESVYEASCNNLKDDFGKMLADYRHLIKQESIEMLVQHASAGQD